MGERLFVSTARVKITSGRRAGQTHKSLQTVLDAMTPHSETVEGYVMDGGCIRKNPRDVLLEKATEHTRDCALMGHCIESGYGIVTEDDQLTMLDPAATPEVVTVVEDSETQEGIVLRVTREEEDGAMETTSVAEVK